MVIKPFTQEFFGKENIREVVREWIKEVQIKNWSLVDSTVEHNIEHFEKLYMKQLKAFITDQRIMYTSKVYYKKFLAGEENKEYLEILRREVKRLFIETCLDKNLYENLKFESYLCTETIEDLFYKGEVYKYLSKEHFFFAKGCYGNRYTAEGDEEEKDLLSLVPQQATQHLVIPEKWMNKFEKLNLKQN